MLQFASFANELLILCIKILYKCEKWNNYLYFCTFRNDRLPETTIREEIPVILKKFRLLNEGNLNNAAAVLFGKELYDYPQCLIRMAILYGLCLNITEAE